MCDERSRRGNVSRLQNGLRLTFGSILKLCTGAVRPPINSSSSRIRRMKAHLIGFATRYHTMPCISRRSSTSVGRAVPLYWRRAVTVRQTLPFVRSVVNASVGLIPIEVSMSKPTVGVTAIDIERDQSFVGGGRARCADRA